VTSSSVGDVIMLSGEREVVQPEVEMSRDAAPCRLTATSQPSRYTSFSVADILRPSASSAGRRPAAGKQLDIHYTGDAR